MRQMHDMHNAAYCESATDDSVAWYVSPSVCSTVTRLRCAKTAERIEVLDLDPFSRFLNSA